MAKLAVCVSVLLVLLVALSETSPTKSCCTQYHDKPIPLRALKIYTIQEITGFCNIKAVIFRTIKDKQVCADPKAPWVIRAMASVPK
ncbi:C-C motif chemokine 20 [Scomber japonicus]|uniref:C-C motif chemokine 20 n=1 Tax=Scomber japonicus TaxID=13676 RepID=UPI0023059EA4|nr:C-C motif chemokine 20 [Scomber japonicus]